jgi:hypothetical protein
MREDKLAERDAQHANTDGDNQLCKMWIDGMDQAKYRVPRNLKANKAFDGLWRPQLRLVGVTVMGEVECYLIMDPDLPKDSNMECSLVR